MLTEVLKKTKTRLLQENTDLYHFDNSISESSIETVCR